MRKRLSCLGDLHLSFTENFDGLQLNRSIVWCMVSIRFLSFRCVVNPPNLLTGFIIKCHRDFRFADSALDMLVGNSTQMIRRDFFRWKT